MVQGLSLGLVLPVVHLIGQRLVNHYFIFSGLVLIARSDVRCQHDVRCQMSTYCSSQHRDGKSHEKDEKKRAKK